MRLRLERRQSCTRSESNMNIENVVFLSVFTYSMDESMLKSVASHPSLLLPTGQGQDQSPSPPRPGFERQLD